MVCKLLKKGLIGAALGAGTLGLLFGTSAPNYVQTAFHKVRASARASVPFEYDIDKARQEVSKLEPAIIQGIEALAKAEVESEHLQKEIVATRNDLNREGRELVTLREHLKTGDVQLTGGVAYSPKEIQRDLARRLDHYTQVKRILAEKEETLKIRQQNVIATRDQLGVMQASKRELMTRIEGIETKLNQMKATRAASRFNFDDSAVGRAKASVAELETRLEEMAKIDELKGKYSERGVSVVVEPSRDVLKEIDAEFGTSSKTREVSADKY
jgi:chromosome segregation ATPase